MKLSMALAFALLANIAFAQSARNQELTIDDIQDELSALRRQNGEEDIAENSRINWKPENSAGKVIIKANLQVRPQVLQVFRQNSKDPADLTPLYIFEKGTSNTALISSANSVKFNHHCRGGAACKTPTGNFNIDKMEPMHHSSRFQNAPMPWSMFFLGSVGIAIHGATRSEYKDLGRPASHGCIRIHPDNGHLLYNLILSEGGTRSGAVVQIF